MPEPCIGRRDVAASVRSCIEAFWRRGHDRRFTRPLGSYVQDEYEVVAEFT
jgi:hypothetical protein